MGCNSHTARDFILIKYGHVFIAHLSQKICAGETRRTRADNGYLFGVGSGAALVEDLLGYVAAVLIELLCGNEFLYLINGDCAVDFPRVQAASQRRLQILPQTAGKGLSCFMSFRASM